jgi:predicted nicotinamide N-methyase
MPGYRTKQERIAISGACDLLICSLLDRQQFADPQGAAAAQGIGSAAWPLFGLVWPSALQLAAHMTRRALVPQQRILEVGCGLALASLVCHRRGADVTASDRHPLAAPFLLRNTSLNHLPPLRYRHGHWGAQPHEPAPEAQTRVHDRYGLIIGSDVLYERDAEGHLSSFIGRHALPTAEVLIVDPNRGNRSAFNHRMEDHGFTLEDTPMRQPLANGDAYRGRMLHYRRVHAASATHPHGLADQR